MSSETLFEHLLYLQRHSITHRSQHICFHRYMSTHACVYPCSHGHLFMLRDRALPDTMFLLPFDVSRAYPPDSTTLPPILPHTLRCIPHTLRCMTPYLEMYDSMCITTPHIHHTYTTHSRSVTRVPIMPMMANSTEKGRFNPKTCIPWYNS